MLFEFIAAGFGGQGILFAGDLLAQAALREGRHVTFLPTYGVAMRGGTANCVVKISDEDIGSPLLEEVHGAIIMNEPSLVKFQPLVRPGGIIVANTSLINPSVFNRDGDVRIVWVPATETARDVVGSEASANMVAVGAFLRAEPVVRLESIEGVLGEFTDPRKQAMAKKNVAALHAGADAVAA